MEKGSIRYLIVLVFAIAIAGMLIYPLFDFLLARFITNSAFVYSVKEYVIEPAIMGVICGSCLWALEKKSR